MREYGEWSRDIGNSQKTLASQLLDSGVGTLLWPSSKSPLCKDIDWVYRYLSHTDILLQKQELQSDRYLCSVSWDKELS